VMLSLKRESERSLKVRTIAEQIFYRPIFHAIRGTCYNAG
jgi:hypothetical protein